MLVSLIFIFNKRSDSRAGYEKYILNFYKNASVKVKSEKETEKAVDEPDMAAYQEFVKTMDPKLKYVPKKRLVKAYRYALEKERDGGYEPDITWEGTESNMGGRTRAIMFDPNDDEHKKVFAGSVTGGLWVNEDITDEDVEWEPVDDFWPDLSISSIAYDPNNTETMYVGTGEAQTARIIYRASSGLGNGIYKTTDGGLNWETLESTTGFDYITDIIVKDENGTSVIYVAVASGVYMGEDHVSQPSDGLFRSDDGGLTWQQVLPDIPGQGVPYTPADIELASNGRIFVGTMENLDKKGGATILYSDTGLPGSWSVYDHYNTVISNEGYYNIPARTILASSPTDPQVVYAQFAAGYVSGFTYYRGRYMAKSLNGGETWQQINIPDADWSTLAWHAFDLKVSPVNPSKVFTGGLDLWNTNNGGANWRHISDWSLMYYGGGDEYVHADQHKIIFNPDDPSKAYFTSDGGVFMTNTAGQNYPVFIQRNQGLNTLQFYTCAIDPTDNSENFLGGLQDNGTLLYTGNPLEITDMIDGGDGAFCFWDKDEPGVYITSVYYNQYSYWNNGQQVTYSNPQNGTFISPADYDYKNNILYSNAVKFSGAYKNNLFIATNVPYVYSGEQYTMNMGTNSNVPFSHVKYSPYSPQGHTTLFLGTEAGKLYKITNAESNSPQAQEITGDNFPNGSISCVAIGSSEDVLLVTFSNYGVPSVWFTTDGGQTWQNKEANLPDMPVRWAIFHPQNDDQVLLATETGVWATNSLSYPEVSWSPAVDGMANVRVDMLKLRTADNVVLAASHGRGLFYATYNLDTYDGVPENSSADNKINIFPNPASSYIDLDLNRETEPSLKTGKIKIFDMAGKTVLEDNYEKNSGSVIDISTLKEGSYILNVITGNKIYKGTFVKVR